MSKPKDPWLAYVPHFELLMQLQQKSIDKLAQQGTDDEQEIQAEQHRS